VALDGSIDWLPTPDLSSPTVFAAVLDAQRGGRFALAPEAPFTADRRYLPGTNVLETTFGTATGSVCVTDAFTLAGAQLAPSREVVRRVIGIAGEVPLRWVLEPRFSFGEARTRIEMRDGVPAASAGADALAVRSFDAGEPECSDGAISGRFVARAGSSSLLALSIAHQEPLVLPTRNELERRLDGTEQTWRRWADGRRYDGPWRDSVLRSVLALKLLVSAPTGAVAAAATTSLPEAIGGGRNWDYRYSWVRDSAFSIDALLELDCAEDAHAYFWWLMHASQLPHPRLNVLYKLDGGNRVPERELGLSGYRDSRPVRVGNAAAEQLQLDTYGELLQTAWLYVAGGHRLDGDFAKRLAEIADLVCELWRRPDAGIWEVRAEPEHNTQSKMMCWLALERACGLADRGAIPGKNAQRWRREQAAVRGCVEGSCGSEAQTSYVRSAGGEDLDASVLLGAVFGYSDADTHRMTTTIDAIRRELARGPLLSRYTGDDGLAGGEGAFVACSFWLAEALAHAGRIDEATELMEELLALANDVGLYAEQIDPETGAFLGNFPQGLSHLALIGAAYAVQQRSAS